MDRKIVRCGCGACNNRGPNSPGGADEAHHTYTAWINGSEPVPSDVRDLASAILAASHSDARAWDDSWDDRFKSMSSAGRLYVWDCLTHNGTLDFDFCRTAHRHMCTALMDVYKPWPETKK